MKLVVLVDNNTLNDKYYLGEPAVSYYIEVDNKRLLFDTGYSDVFIRNARKMNISVDDIDAIAISHGHEDHSNGLKYYLDNVRDKRILLYAHPLAFNKKKLDGEMICSPYSMDLLSEYFEIRTSKNPINITDRLIFLGVSIELANRINDSITNKKEEPKETLNQKGIGSSLAIGLLLVTMVIVIAEIVFVVKK